MNTGTEGKSPSVFFSAPEIFLEIAAGMYYTDTIHWLCLWDFTENRCKNV